MRENDTTKWVDGLRCVQWQKNNRLHSGIGRTPYTAMFGKSRYADTTANNLPDEIWDQLQSEKDLAAALGIEGAATDSSEEGDEREEDENDSILEETEEEIIENDEEEVHPDIKSLFASALNGAIEIVIHQQCSVCDVVHGALTKCFICDTYCHDVPPCSQMEGSDVVCQQCIRSANIRNERNMARINQEKQAERMVSETAKRFKPAALGDNVLVPIPDVDRGRTDFRNIPGVVTNVGTDGTYVIGTISGTLKQPYVRSQFIPTQAAMLNVTDVPEKEISLREVAQKQSLCHSQGFLKCQCNGSCSNDLVLQSEKKM